MISDAEVRALDAGEREHLLRLLIAAQDAQLPRAPYRRRRAIFLALVASSAVLLVAWIVGLGFTLPPRETTGHWRLLWIGFDAAELAALCVLVWAAARSRQVLVPASLVTGTLLMCDAWFDVVLSWDTSDRWWSVASALLIEVPAGLWLWQVARRLVQLALTTTRRQLGIAAPPPPLHRMPLLAPIVDLLDPDPQRSYPPGRPRTS